MSLSRSALITTAVVLGVCLVLVGFAVTELTAAPGRISLATGRAGGVVDSVRDESVALVRWAPPGQTERVDAVPISGAAPAPGTRTEVAFDPSTPADPLVPGSSVLVDADSALTSIALVVVVALMVLAVGAWQVVTRRRAFAQHVRSVAVRRVRWQAGLGTRSYLETESQPQRWIPVHFDPVLVPLPSPTTVQLHGDPLRDRLVAATTIDGTPLIPSGPVRLTEPRGHRTDNASRPDDTAAARGTALARMCRQLQADLPMVVPAPFIGLLWTYVDNGGAAGWATATALTAALGLWLAAVRGSDPSSAAGSVDRPRRPGCPPRRAPGPCEVHTGSVRTHGSSHLGRSGVSAEHVHPAAGPPVLPRIPREQLVVDEVAAKGGVVDVAAVGEGPQHRVHLTLGEVPARLEGLRHVLQHQPALRSLRGHRQQPAVADEAVEHVPTGGWWRSGARRVLEQLEPDVEAFDETRGPQLLEGLSHLAGAQAGGHRHVGRRARPQYEGGDHGQPVGFGQQAHDLRRFHGRRAYRGRARISVPEA